MQKYKSNIKENALQGIANGIQIATNAVKGTMGAKGNNVCMEQDEFPFVSVCNDGATIIDLIQLEDPAEKMGLYFLKEAVSRSNSNAGDGSTTTCVLLNAIVQEGIKSGATGIEIKNSLDSLLPFIEQKIDEQKRTIDTSGVVAVATIAGESEEMGTLLGEIYSKIGKDGIIHLEGSGTFETSYDFIEGVRFANTGYLSPYMVHDEQAVKEGRKETKAIYENPTILVTKRKITSLNEINPLLETLSSQDKKDLVIFTDDMDSGVASIMVHAHRSKVFNILVIKAPVVYKGAVFDDFAKCTGATIVEDSSGVNFKNLPLSALGTCAKIVVDKEETLIIGTLDITEHIAELKNQQDIESQMRLSWLTQKTVLLKLGAMSETDLFYKRLKCEDAIHSSRLALQDGIVAGGGIALLNLSREMPDSVGGNIIKEAFKAPLNQIVLNATGRNFIDLNEVMGNKFDPFISLEGKNKTFGFNAKTGEIVEMFDAGIVDSALIVKNAVKNAIGIASTVLTTSALISKPEETPEQIAYKMMQNKGMRPF